METAILRLISGIETCVAFVLISAYRTFVVGSDDFPNGVGRGVTSKHIGVEVVVDVEAEYHHALVSFEYLLELIGPFVQQVVVHLVVALFLSPRSIVFFKVNAMVV